MRSCGRRPLKFLLLPFLFASCVATREISPPYKPRVEALVRQLSEQPYSVHIVENLRVLARVDMRSRRIELHARFADVLMSKDPNMLRAILAHEIAHDKLSHHHRLAESRHEIQVLEIEADEEAVKILHVGGYDTRDYLRALKMIKEIEDKNPSSFREQYYSSHPYAGERLERVEHMIATLGFGPKNIGERAEKPEWKVGYEWKYNWKSPVGSGTVTREIIREEAFEGVQSWVVRVGRNEQYYTKDVLGEMAIMSRGKLITKRTPPRRFVSWPLEVGREWKDIYLLDSPEEKSSRKLNIRRVVSKIEVVSTAAGTFEAFKIESYNQSDGRLLTEHWYSSVAKWFVKLKETLRDGAREDELTSFKGD